MKKYIVFLLWIFGFNMVPQGFNTAFHKFYDKGVNIIAVNNNVYFSSEVNLGFPDSAYITSVNYSGQLRFKKGIKKNEYTHLNKLLLTLDNKICFIGYAMGCDYLDNSQRTFIMKMDTIGGISFNNTFSNLYANNQNDYLVDLVQIADSSYYCITDSVLFHFNKSGALIKKKNTGLTALQTIINYGQNQLLLSGKSSGINKHIVIDTNAAIINSKPSYGAVTKYGQLSSGNVIALQNGVLKKISPALLTTDSSAVSQGNTGIVDFEIEQDTIFSIGTLNSSYNYIKFDSSFVNKYQFSTNAGRIVPQGITTTGNNVTLLSNSTNTVSNSNQFIGLTSFNKTGTFTYDNDIGVVSVTMDSSNVAANYSQGMTQYTGSYRLKVVVKNFGVLPAQKYYLNHYLHPEICGKAYYHPLITVPLAPGATFSITTPLFGNNLLGVFPGPPSNQTFSLTNACVYTTLPNNENDVDFSNDAFCITVLFPYATSIEQNLAENYEVTFSPNPFHDKILILSEVEMRKVEVFDLMGQLIKSFVVGGGKAELGLEEAAGGIYFIKIFSAKAVVIKKAVKE